MKECGSFIIAKSRQRCFASKREEKLIGNN
jgi:hypothetical protein